MITKKCIYEGCEEIAEKGRRYCHKHFLQRKRERYAEQLATGTLNRTVYKKKCLCCGKEFNGWKKTSLYCSRECAYKASKTLSSGVNPYEYKSKDYKESIFQHRAIAIKLLGRKLQTNEVVHHLDLNPMNNALTNLIVLTRSKHTSLHAFINKQRALLEQSNNGNVENCWKTLIVPMTTTWLETANVKVIKLWEIGQSAAEPLLNEEGSETMHDTSQVDDDIVQTTTV